MLMHSPSEAPRGASLAVDLIELERPASAQCQMLVLCHDDPRLVARLRRFMPADRCAFARLPQRLWNFRDTDLVGKVVEWIRSLGPSSVMLVGDSDGDAPGLPRSQSRAGGMFARLRARERHVREVEAFVIDQLDRLKGACSLAGLDRAMADFAVDAALYRGEGGSFVIYDPARRCFGVPQAQETQGARP